MLKYLLVENKRINVYVLLVFGLFGAVKRTEAMDDPKKALERQLLFEHAKDDIKNLGLCLGRQERFFKAWNRLSDEEKAKIVQDESFCGGYYSLFEGYSAHRDYDDITYELMLHGADPSLQNKLIDETFLHRWFV